MISVRHCLISLCLARLLRKLQSGVCEIRMTVLTKPFTGALAKKPEAGADDDKLLIKVYILILFKVIWIHVN